MLRQPEDRNGYPTYPIDEEGAVPKLMRKHGNILCDLSAGSGHNALARDPEHAIAFLTEFQDRALFGLDICAPDTPAPIVGFLKELWAAGKLSSVVFDKIVRGNACRILGVS